MGIQFVFGVIAGAVLATLFWLAVDNFLWKPSERKAKAMLKEAHARMHDIIV